MNNIILIGMPGAGKSTLGVLLAKALCKEFVDTDLVIQKYMNKTLQEIINEDGIDTFLKIEQECLLGLDLENSVVATGGSVVYSEILMNKFKRTGLFVYLFLDISQIESRIRNITTRGIAKSNETSLKDLFKERTPLYQKYADIIIDCTDKSVEDCIIEVLNYLDKFNP